MRILSLLPSATEIVYTLGLGDELVGVSHECDYPPEVRTKPSVVIPWEQVVGKAPEVIVVMPCGYKIERTLAEMNQLSTLVGWSSLPAVRNGRVFIVDSPSYFSRPGPRTITGLEILAEIIHPEIFSGLIPAGAAAKFNN